MRVLLLVGLVLFIVACSGGSGEETTAHPTVSAITTTSAPTSSTTTTASGPSPESEAGAFTVHVPSAGASDIGVAVRVFFPARDATRYPEGAPVVVALPGGWDTGDLSAERPPTAASGGYIRIEILLPGGSASDGTVSGGVHDTRGKAAVQAVVDVLEYAAGTRTDMDGMLLLDRVDYALVDNLGIYSWSNGGNLAIVALAETDATSTPVKWLVSDETPFGDQQAMGELNRNPFFEPGTCAGLTCPWPGLRDALIFEPDASSMGILGSSNWPGRFSARGDGDVGGIFFRVVPGVPEQGQKAFVSNELLEDIWASEATLFATDGPPDWLPTEDEAAEFWDLRNGSRRIGDASANHPDLLVCVLQRERDHLQTSPDYPHTWMHLEGWSDLGHRFFRLNPDAEYIALVTGQDASQFPDNDAGTLVPWPDPLAAMVPNNVYGVVEAAMLEMMDRTWSGDRSPNLDTAINP